VAGPAIPAADSKVVPVSLDETASFDLHARAERGQLPREVKTRGAGFVYTHTIATSEPHSLAAPFSLERFHSGYLIDEHGASGAEAESRAPPTIACGRSSKLPPRLSSTTAFR
jgi:hypothetical protein